MNNNESKMTALYERLSRDDDLQGDSNSIVNQKLYLQAYAEEHGFANCRHYTDDGYSGGNFERPGWKQLIADIEAGKVGTVIAKDMSRVGRNYLETGFYTEVVFRKCNVRFIAIANGVDNINPESGEFVPILNVMNEWYLRDQSRKMIAAYRQKGNAGLPTNNNCIYGYRKDPEQKNHWLVDEEAAQMVRRIYQMACEGHGAYEIARMLTQEKVDSPGFYFSQHRCGMRQNYTDASRAHDWNGATVTRILTHQEYMGHTVNFRSGKRFFKDDRHMNPPEDWVIFEHTHEAIVTKDVWELAQRALKSRKRTDTLGEANPLTGLMYCADYGARMYNHRCGELDVLIKKLYEAYALEKITEKRFDELLAGYEAEQAELNEAIQSEQAGLDSYEASTENMEAFMALARKYRDVEELTTPMIYDFVDRIIVHAPQKINGERHMQVEIILRFIGNFQAPRPESTAEEIEQAEKDRQRRAQNRERDARRREKKAAEQQKKERQVSHENGQVHQMDGLVREAVP